MQSRDLDTIEDAHLRAVAVTVDVDDPAPSAGVVAALLDRLDRKLVKSTWFLPGEVDAALVERLFYTGHETAGLVRSVSEISATVRGLTAHDVGVLGVRVVPHAAHVEPTTGRELVELTASAGLSYLSIPAESVAAGELDGGSVLRGRSLTLLPPPPASLELEADPVAWLQGAQVAIGRVLQHDDFHELSIDLRAMDRSASFDAVAEAVDLVSGLQRAERLRVERLDRLVASLTERGPESPRE